MTFLFLMRQGYRWARTLLTGGGVASVVYAGTSLLPPIDRTASAVVYAVSAIVGSVLIVGGVVPAAPQGRPRILHPVG